MSYGDFNAQIKARGATEIRRIAEDKKTEFTFGGRVWECSDGRRPEMTTELADGYEMAYCLGLYCSPQPQQP
jgi:hypothetical protein